MRCDVPGNNTVGTHLCLPQSTQQPKHQLIDKHLSLSAGQTIAMHTVPHAALKTLFPSQPPAASRNEEQVSPAGKGQREGAKFPSVLWRHSHVAA